MSYLKSLSSDFGGGLNPEQFRDEVNMSSIVPECLMVLNISDDVTITFDSSLSTGEETTLDGLVSAHVPITPTGDNEHIDHTEVIITAGTALTGTNDIKTNTTLDFDLTTLDAESTVDPAADLIAIYDDSTSSHKKVLIQDIPSSGEANTASNVGSGADIFKQKTGTDLEFRGVSAGSSKITTALNGDNIDIDAVPDEIMPGTTKGDIIVHNGTTHVRLPIGLENQFLVATPSDPNGIIWSDLDFSLFGRDLQQAAETSLALTSSTSYVDMPGMTLTTSNTKDSLYVITFSGEFTVSNANRTVSVIANIDGVQISSVEFNIGAPSSGRYTSIPFTYVNPTVIGNGVVIKMQWKVTGGTATISSRTRVLIINVFPV